ncbi:MAG: amidohydrolase family protein, partial [Pirellula sp.]
MNRALLAATLKLLLCLAPTISLAQRIDTRPDVGIAEHKINDFLLTNARVILEPGQVIESASIWIEDGKIVQVGASIQPREGLRVIDMAGKSIYPGFIDIGLETDLPEFTAKGGTPHWNPEITPQRSVAATAESLSSLQALRRAGITTALFAPKDGIIKGTSALAMTADTPLAANLLRSDMAMHVRLTVSRNRGSGSYPSSPMGAVALARQTFLDTQWYDAASRAYRSSPDLPKPEADSALDSIQQHIASGKLFVFDTLNEQYALRADSFAKEFGLKALLRGSGQEYQLVDLISKTGRTFILPVNFPKPPNVATIEAVLDTELEELMHWEIAPENPARLDRAGVPFVLTSSGLSDPSEFIGQVRKAIARGLDPTKALAAVTTKPAELLGIADQLGKIRSGYWANFIIASGDLWDEKTRIEEVWVRGTRPAAAFKNEKDIDGLWDIAILDAKSLGEPSKPPFDKFQVSIKDSLKKVVATLILPPLPQPDAAKDSETPKEEPKKETNRSIKMTAPRWSDLTLSGKATTKELLGKTASDSTPDKSEASDVGVALLSMALIGTGDNPSLLVGTIQLPDGTQWTVRGTKGPLDEQSKEDKNKDTKKDDEKKEKQAALHTTMRYPMASFGLESIPEQPNVLVVQNTTLWTGGPAGILRDADMIVRNGKIEAIGIDLPVPEGATI